jgi:hypothetical protein
MSWFRDLMGMVFNVRGVKDKVASVGKNIYVNSLRTCASVMHVEVADIRFMKLFRW